MKGKTYFFAALATVLAVGPAGAVGQSGSEANQRQAQDGATVVVPAGTKDRPIRVSAGVIAGLILHKVDPVYPADARDAGISGAVVMRVRIDDQGKIEKLSVVSGPEKLHDAATTAVNQWRYKPYLLNGKPVFVDSMITVNFNIAN
jgi:protein TonB